MSWTQELTTRYRQFYSAYYLTHDRDLGEPMFWEFLEWLDE